jgi:hypothetical protein
VRAHAVDGVVHRENVVGQGAREAALLALRIAEVDHPGDGPALVEEADGARVGRDVPHLGRHHERRDQDDRRTTVAGRGKIPPQPVRRPFRSDLVR